MMAGGELAGLVVDGSDVYHSAGFVLASSRVLSDRTA